MKRLLLVTHRAPTQQGGPAARWRSLGARLPALGWEMDVVCAPERASAVEFAPDEQGRRAAARRAAVMGAAGRMAGPVFGLAGVRPEAMPLSMAWVPRGAAEVRRRLRDGDHDAVLATGPPMAGLLAARAGVHGSDVPLVAEFRDLWAGNPAFDRRGGLLGAAERWVLGRCAAIVACTPEAAADLRARHPELAEGVREVPNGFEPELLERRNGPAPGPAAGPLTILHSGTLTADRPLAPLLRVLARDPWRSSFRLVLHGHLAPPIAREVAAAAADVEVVPPTSWADAVDRIARADVALVSQARGAGDATAVASKVYEYLALGKPVLCLSDGGATEALLHRLGAGQLSARLDDERSIEAALERMRNGERPDAVDAERLAPYDRTHIAERMAAVLDAVAAGA